MEKRGFLKGLFLKKKKKFCTQFLRFEGYQNIGVRDELSELLHDRMITALIIHIWQVNV